MKEKNYIGIDLGGTNVRAGIVNAKGIEHWEALEVDAAGSVERVLGQIYEVVEKLDAGRFDGIGIGVPGLVDTRTGVVFDVMNIPSWKKVPLKEKLEGRFGVPASVNNDANCFALAERFFGQGKNVESFIGLIVGTGMAGGIIINGKLYEGRNCGAGEFGMMRYLDHFYEYYSSGQFFDHAYGISGAEAARRAKAGDEKARQMWQTFGTHVGKAVEAILYAYDPEAIILGGSVGQAFQLYEGAVWKTLKNCPYQQSVKNLKILVSRLEQPGLLGAAALRL